MESSLDENTDSRHVFVSVPTAYGKHKIDFIAVACSKLDFPILDILN